MRPALPSLAKVPSMKPNGKPVRLVGVLSRSNLNLKPEGLWASGTYWHLETRPDELECLEDQALKDSAVSIDRKDSLSNLGARRRQVGQLLLHSRWRRGCGGGLSMRRRRLWHEGFGLLRWEGDHESEKMENTVLSIISNNLESFSI